MLRRFPRIPTSTAAAATATRFFSTRKMGSTSPLTTISLLCPFSFQQCRFSSSQPEKTLLHDGPPPQGDQTGTAAAFSGEAGVDGNCDYVIAGDKPQLSDKEKALKEKMEAMRQKYAAEGASSDAVGSLMPQDEETKLGYNANMYFLTFAREFAPAATLASSFLAYGALYWILPAYFATLPALGAWMLGTMLVQRFVFLKGASASRGPIDMRGKVCVVLGASSDGIGRQVAAAFVAAGAEVLISHNTGSAHDAVAGVAKAAERKWKHIIPQGSKERTAEAFERRIVAWPLALEDRLSIVKFISIMKQRFPGGVDVFCNCAGGTPDVGDIVMTKNGFEHHIDTFFLGTLQISDAVQQGMMRKQGGSLANAVGDSDNSPKMSYPDAKPKTPRLCYVVHPGHTLIRGKNIIGRYFSPSKMVQDWRFSNVKQSHIGMFGLACNVVDMAKHGKQGTTNQTCGVLVYPGRVASKYRRNTMPSWTTIWKWPLVAFAMRTPYEGAQSMVYAATSDDITPASYVSNCKIREHWKSRTLYNEKLCHDIVEWGRAQLRGSVSNVIKKERAAVAQQAAKDEQEKRRKK